MLKNILNLEGAQQLTKNEQKTINGGFTKQCNDALSAGGCTLTITGTCTDPNYIATPFGICGAGRIACCPV